MHIGLGCNYSFSLFFQHSLWVEFYEIVICLIVFVVGVLSDYWVAWGHWHLTLVPGRYYYLLRSDWNSGLGRYLIVRILVDENGSKARVHSAGIGPCWYICFLICFAGIFVWQLFFLNFPFSVNGDGENRSFLFRGGFPLILFPRGVGEGNFRKAANPFSGILLLHKWISDGFFWIFSFLNNSLSIEHSVSNLDIINKFFFFFFLEYSWFFLSFLYFFFVNTFIDRRMIFTYRLILWRDCWEHFVDRWTGFDRSLSIWFYCKFPNLYLADLFCSSWISHLFSLHVFIDLFCENEGDLTE